MLKNTDAKRCHKELTTNSNGNLTELTPKFKEINATLARIYSCRTMRLKSKKYQSSAA